MKFEQIAGNEDVKKALVGMVDSGKVPHALLFHENDGGGGVALSCAFLQYLYCHNRSLSDSCAQCPTCNRMSKLIHPDVHFVFPVVSKTLSSDYSSQWRDLVLSNPYFSEDDFLSAMGFAEKSPVIAVAEAKKLIDTLSLSALEGGYRSVLVYLPERMNTETANKLLKLLEEPPVLTQFVMVTHAPEKILPTILSRCQRIRLIPEKGREASTRQFPQFALLMKALVAKDLAAALKIGEELSALPSREEARAFCKASTACLREIFLIQQKLTQLSSPTGELSLLAGELKKTFPRLAMPLFDRAASLLGRNVNMKILFTDLVDRLYRLQI